MSTIQRQSELNDIIQKLDAIDEITNGIRLQVAILSTMTTEVSSAPYVEPSRFAKSLAQPNFKDLTWTTSDNKPYTEMTDGELVVELMTLNQKQEDAKGWGAAVGVRQEYIEDIEREQRRRERLRKHVAERGTMRFVPPEEWEARKEYEALRSTRRATDDLA